MENRSWLSHTRTFMSKLLTRAESESEQEKVIEGYFAVFDNETELWPGASESIATGAFERFRSRV